MRSRDPLLPTISYFFLVLCHGPMDLPTMFFAASPSVCKLVARPFWPGARDSFLSTTDDGIFLKRFFLNRFFLKRFFFKWFFYKVVLTVPEIIHLTAIRNASSLRS
mmetsp:Transcript_57813/g.187864  ORF Transcript_57813/g.187864 Transcript_57813/m.187864 type:complete len:106 (+) Transcript_57813:1215-1532(+)